MAPFTPRSSTVSFLLRLPFTILRTRARRAFDAQSSPDLGACSSPSLLLSLSFSRPMRSL